MHFDPEKQYQLFCMDGAAGMLSLPSKSVKLIYGSPPYPNAERVYGVWKSSEYIAKMTPFINGAKHVLRDDGFIVINVKANREKPVGNASSKRSLIVEELALRMESDWGLYCVDIEIWVKGNPVPTGLRCACQDAYEQNLWFSVSPKWSINLDAIRRPYVQHSMDLYGEYEYKPRSNGLSYVRKNKVISANPLGALPNNVITGGVAQGRSGHQAVQPLYLPEKYIKAVTDKGDLVLDPWVGSGTTGVAAIQLGRRFIGFDIYDHFISISEERVAAALHVLEG